MKMTDTETFTRDFEALHDKYLAERDKRRLVVSWSDRVE